MSENLTKADMINLVAQKTGLKKNQAGNALEAVFQTIQESLVEGKKFTMTGFGTFSVNARKSRTGRNPQTGAKIVIPGKLVPKFKAGKNLKQALESIESMSKWVNK
jgi:DNA-binding protein HU-beta